MKHTVESLIDTNYYNVGDEVIMRELAYKMVTHLPLDELKKIFNFTTTEIYEPYQQVKYTMTITLLDNN